MAKDVDLKFTCPQCGKEVDVHAPIDPIQLAPMTRSRILPVGSVFVYKINSEDMKAFITAKAKKMVSDIKVEVVPLYTERRHQRPNEPHRSYASLRIAFSEQGLEKQSDDGWFGRVGETNSNIRVVSSLFHGIIQKYQYQRKDIEAWLKSYKNMEELEETLGITEKYINDLRLYSTPQSINTNGKERWVIFAAAAEHVIADMLSVPETDKPEGRFIIQDVYNISKDVVEWLVYVHPNEMQLKENPRVRQIMLGEEKAKR